MSDGDEGTGDGGRGTYLKARHTAEELAGGSSSCFKSLRKFGTTLPGCGCGLSGACSHATHGYVQVYMCVCGPGGSMLHGHKFDITYATKHLVFCYYVLFSVCLLRVETLEKLMYSRTPPF